MIEKLKTINPYDETEINMDANSVGGLVYENTPLIQKLNELVDAVNGLQEAFELIHPYLKYKNLNKVPDGPYAEQRKWIGKLCKFWNIDKDNATYGILEEVATNWVCRFKAKDDQYLWDHCEPVKSTDSIIYKGGDNE